MIDDELHGLERIHTVRIAAEPGNAVAHGGEIDHGGHAGEVLQEHARRGERDFTLRAALQIPSGQRLDVRLLDEAPVFLPQQVLEQDFQRVRQPGDFGESGGLQGRQAVNMDRRARPADLQGGPGPKAVHSRHVAILSKKPSYHE